MVVEDKKASLFSSQKKSVLKDQSELCSELLEKVCKLEGQNKKLVFRYKKLSEELDKAEEEYKSRVQLMYSIALRGGIVSKGT